MSQRARVVGASAVCVATALACAGLALADTPPGATIPDTTDQTTTAVTVTTDPAATTDVTATAPAPTATTATAPATTTTTPRAAPSTTKRSSAGVRKTVACIGAGPLLLLLPHRPPESVGSVSARVPAGVGATALRYPADGSVLRVGAERADVSGCAHGTQPATATSSLRGLNLFGGEVRARLVVATLLPAKSPGLKWRLRLNVKGLVVDRRFVTMRGGTTVPVGNWGRLKLDGRRAPRTTRSSTIGLGWWRAGLSLRLTRPHAGLPAGTLLLIAYVAADRPFTPRPHAPKGGVPLKVTPPLLAGPYTFPVVGDALFSDTYGGPRSDVPGGWHHGDDIFSPLGRPVLAVADGKVYSVGWNRLGGWRLWLRDAQGNRFYYAHLSGYTKYARNGTHVKAGQQLGFVGNTGDAFTTPDHLHFEIHPKGLLHLHYAGAVDPTTYLDRWRRVEHVIPLRPVRLPAGAERHGKGAVSDYRQLLAVRGIRRPAAQPQFIVDRPLPAAAAAASSAPPGTQLVKGIVAALLALFAVAGLVLRKRRAAPTSPD